MASFLNLLEIAKMSNVFSFTGIVGRDAETRVLNGGGTVLNVTVANNIGFGDKQETLWVRVSLFGKRAVNLAEYLKKGQPVFVSGELSLNVYPAKDGSMKANIELNANILDLLGKRRESTANPATTTTNTTGRDNFSDDAPYDDDIPF